MDEPPSSRSYGELPARDAHRVAIDTIAVSPRSWASPGAGASQRKVRGRGHIGEAGTRARGRCPGCGEVDREGREVRLHSGRTPWEPAGGPAPAHSEGARRHLECVWRSLGVRIRRGMAPAADGSALVPGLRLRSRRDRSDPPPCALRVRLGRHGTGSRWERACAQRTLAERNRSD